MSIISILDITIISLLLSISSIISVLLLLTFIRKQVRTQVNSERDLNALALVEEFGGRQKELERRLIDEKVRVEILELRLSKQTQMQPVVSESISRRSVDVGDKEHDFGVDSTSDWNQEGSSIESSRRQSDLKRKRLDSRTINEILVAVMEGDGKVTARQIQEKIGRSREHTARMMNLLYREGLVLRDSRSRPFVYSLTKRGESELERVA